MVSKCANPDCEKRLHYLREGKVYLFETFRKGENGAPQQERQNEHFWLCGECVRTMSLEYSRLGGVRAVRRAPGARLVGPAPKHILAS